MAALANAPVLIQPEPGWIYNKSWDLSRIILSAVLVPLPFLIAYAAQKTGWISERQAIDVINILVAGLVGGPHLFSTITVTFLDRSFRRSHPRYTWLSLLIPVVVIYLGVYQYTLLMTFFFSWASLHVLHQIIYLSDCYRAKNSRPDPLWSRLVDYGVILTGLYPIGMYKLSQRKFRVGGVVLPYPDWLLKLHLPEVAGVAFTLLMIAWVAKTVVESRQGRLSRPKTLLIGITSVVSFLLPMGSNLDILFQGYNTWHSFQYLFLMWLINRLRYQRGEIDNPFVRALAARESMVPYYLCFLGATGVTVVITFVVRALTSLSADQSYFVVILSTLLMHYYFDHFLFTRTEYVL
ncbi:MAG TPA: hypothetical protein VMT86_22905 [Bryobacteraceae bacterium]|nr:hypothetical protein [Bryobacteraceae bacterium]